MKTTIIVILHVITTPGFIKVKKKKDSAAFIVKITAVNYMF